jgi:hypothetical protein
MANRFNPNPDLSQEYVNPELVYNPVIKPRVSVQDQEKIDRQNALNARFLEVQKQKKEREQQYQDYLQSRSDAVVQQKQFVEQQYQDYLQRRSDAAVQQKQFELPKLSEKQRALRDEFLYKTKTREEQSRECPVCLDNDADKKLACGHKVCEDCSAFLKTCPICRKEIMKMTDDKFCIVM